MEDLEVFAWGPAFDLPSLDPFSLSVIVINNTTVKQKGSFESSVERRLGPTGV
jgi:hypothetical protein